MYVNAFAKSKASEVARKSLTNEGRASADSSASGQPNEAGAPSKKNETVT
jgi:hypothetical protein